MPTDWRKDLGDRIRVSRRTFGWTQRQLAGRLGNENSQGQVSKWEAGSVVPDPENVQQMVKMFGDDQLWRIAQLAREEARKEAAQSPDHESARSTDPAPARNEATAKPDTAGKGLEMEMVQAMVDGKTIVGWLRKDHVVVQTGRDRFVVVPIDDVEEPSAAQVEKLLETLGPQPDL